MIPFIFLYILLICKRNSKGRKNIILYTIIFAIVGAMAFNFIMKTPVLYNAIGVRLESLIEGQEDESKLDSSARNREIMRNDAIEQWWEKPFFGYGFDSYKYRAQVVTGHFHYSHCNYTEMLYNGGIVMLIAYYWIFYKIIRDFCKKKNVEQKYRAFAIAVALCFIIFDYGAVSYSLSYVQIMLAMALKGLSFSD